MDGQQSELAWTCACGQENKGNFCANCGKKRPALSAVWHCTCGQENTGRFCVSCGQPCPELESAALPSVTRRDVSFAATQEMNAVSPEMVEASAIPAGEKDFWERNKKRVIACAFLAVVLIGLGLYYFLAMGDARFEREAENTQKVVTLIKDDVKKFKDLDGSFKDDAVKKYIKTIQDDKAKIGEQNEKLSRMRVTDKYKTQQQQLSQCLQQEEAVLDALSGGLDALNPTDNDVSSGDKLLKEFRDGADSLKKAASDINIEHTDFVVAMDLTEINKDVAGYHAKLRAVARQKEAEAKRQALLDSLKVKGYQTYSNFRFGYNIDYPDNFVAGGYSSTAGLNWISADGKSRLMVSAYPKSRPRSAEQMYRDELSNMNVDIGYNTCGGNWYVITWTKEGKSFYKKSFIGNAAVNYFIFSYPTDQKTVYEEVVAKIEASFKPGYIDLSI